MDARVPQEEIEAAVRQYLARVGRRYLPLAGGLASLLLVVSLVPTVNSRNQAASPGQAGLSAGSPGAGTSPVSGSSSPTGGNVAAGTTGGGASFQSAGGQGGQGGGQAALAADITPPAAADSAGVARSGVSCGPGVRQVPWTAYSPLCIPAYHGDNGGATAHGVTATTITAVFRRTNSVEEKAAFAAVGSAAPGTDDQYLADLRTYVDYFNKNYELYGRQLKVADYNGVGDNLQEDQGQDLQGAQADAATAYAKGGFLDLSSSPTLASTQPYEEGLAAEHVIAIGAVGLPKAWFAAHAPYEYSISPDGSSGAQAVVLGLCDRLAGLPAIFAGNPLYQHENRVFGLITPDNTQYVELGKEVVSGVKARCGLTIKQWSRYSIDVTTEEEQSLSIVGQMNASGVTTTICVCDPVFEVFISDNASGQHYDPEWLAVNWLDPLGRVEDQGEWAHAMSANWVVFPPKPQDEAYQVYKLANPTGEPQEQYYAEAYWTALYTFDVLQQAGPDLTPLSFQHGAFTLPRSNQGMFGIWQGSDQGFSPETEVQLQYWDPNAISNFDGKKGAWVACESGRWFSFATGPGQPHTQFHCFGK